MEALEAFVWPGGYPLAYFTEEGDVLCAACATYARDKNGETTTPDIHWEGEALRCDECDTEIESAYGVPDGDSDEVLD